MTVAFSTSSSKALSGGKLADPNGTSLGQVSSSIEDQIYDNAVKVHRRLRFFLYFADIATSVNRFTRQYKAKLEMSVDIKRQ